MPDKPSEDLREAMDDADADAEAADGEGEGDDAEAEGAEAGGPEGAAAQRIRGLRNRLRKRRVKRGSKKAKRRANRERRKQKLKNALLPGTETTRGEAKAEISELAQETGVTRDRASRLVDQAQTAAAKAGEAVALDIDDDGDVDLLAGDGSIEAVETPREKSVFKPVIGGVEDDFEEIGNAGVEAELGLDEPIEEDFDGLFR